MKFSRFLIAVLLLMSCICVALSVDAYVKSLTTEIKVDTFTVEIEGLTNMQKSQMEFSHLQTTINELGFCLQATQIENQELVSNLQKVFNEVNMLRANLQQTGIFINGLLQENTELKQQIQEFEKDNVT